MSHVYELRQYTLHPGQREVLIELFDSEFVEPQEELGMEVVGQFRDLDRPDHFVWVRGFADMPARQAALSAFYGGPVWAAHKDVANGTMIDSDDVLLLRPAADGTGFPPGTRSAPAEADTAAAPAEADTAAATPEPGTRTALTTAGVYRFTGPVGPEVLASFEREVEPLLVGSGSSRTALLCTETSANTYPALPVREGEHVVVRFGRYADVDTHAAAAGVRARVAEVLAPYLLDAPVEMRLEPTTRSVLR